MTALDAADFEVEDAKARDALARYRFATVDAAAGPAFDEAYGALFSEFGPRGEIERREVVTAWLARGPAPLDGLRWRYALIAAHDVKSGALAGVRDCHVTVDAPRRECVVYLAHTLVMPEHRRGGLASLLRAAPVSLGRSALRAAGIAPGDAALLLAAEMEPAELDRTDSLVRLVAYGRAGFSAVGAEHLPYCQPDFRDLDAVGEPPRPLPLLAVVRFIDHDGEAALPPALCEAYLRHLYAVFATHCRERDLVRPRDHALGALHASGADPVPLLPLPRALDDHERLAPLLRATVLRHHLPELQ